MTDAVNGNMRLDRRLPRLTPSRIRYEDGEGNEYPGGPASLLARKFEETNSGPDEDMYDDYARRTLMDRTADTTLLAHEDTRGAVNKNKGILQHHYYGHRGCEDVDRPELFLGFAGPDNHDPRGINVDPDMRKYRSQAEARNRFIRLTPDDSAFITGGGRSQGQLRADQQTLRRWARDRLKVFDRQMDGRREGLRRTAMQQESSVSKSVVVQGYGDLIRDYALNPQRRANLICRQAIRNSRAWREGTADQDFAIAKYSQTCRRAKTSEKFQRVLGAQNADDTIWSDADSTIQFKTMGMLMSTIIAARKNRSAVIAGSDRDYSDATDSQARRSTPAHKDLEAVMYAIINSGDFGTSDTTRTGKNVAPQERQHLARVTVANHLTPAQHYLNAEIIYKSLRQGGDLSKIQQQVLGDATQTQTTEDVRIAAKSARMRMVSGAKLQTDDDTDKGDAPSAVISYKGLKPSKKPTADATRIIADGAAGESDNTQARRTNTTNYRTTNADDVDHMTQLYDNTSKERHGGRLGTKYTFRQMDRDGQRELSELS